MTLANRSTTKKTSRENGGHLLVTMSLRTRALLVISHVFKLHVTLRHAIVACQRYDTTDLNYSPILSCT